MPKPVDTKHEQLTDLAWEQISEAVHTGRITLPNKDTIALSTKDYASLLRWLADKRPPQRRTVPLVEDFEVQTTQESGS